MSDDHENHLDDDEEPFDPEQADAEIQAFIEAADRASDPPTERLTQEVLGIVGRAWDDVAAVTGTQPNNKVVAMMLSASRRARELDPSEREYWIASAASTILSSQIPAAQAEPER